MNNQEEYIQQLEQVINKFLEPLKGIPFSVAIKALTGFEVLAFDLSDERNKKLLEQLKEAAQLGGKKAFKEGIVADRANEAGNRIEPFIINALNKVGLKADQPITKSGRKKITGYPDIQIEDEWNRTIYLDCKTYNARTKNQNFRTFYFSPSENPKITKDAFHLLMSFELKQIREKTFIPISWGIYTLDKLKMQVKHEFNAGNKDLYTNETLLAQGEIKNDQ